jgi:hypothetical protein
MIPKRQLFLLPLCLVLLSGCDSGRSAPAVISGTVTYNGNPVTGGDITFHTAAGGYSATINPDGTYTVAQVPDGEATVTVLTEGLNPAKKPQTYGGARGKGQMGSPAPEGAKTGSSGQYVKIPKKYETKETSDLKVTITRGKQTHPLTLKD